MGAEPRSRSNPDEAEQHGKIQNLYSSEERWDIVMTDNEYMAHAIELARCGRGWTNPNPMVGAVIVKEGRIIGEGYHARYGGLHAERNAFAALTEPAEGATLYVTLEPCCHYGKTPPCTQAILEHGIHRVVVGSGDPNPLVAGKGIRQLRQAGIVVDEGVMKEECDRLNAVFFHYITTKTPYVVMKYAMTADGKIATKTGESKWITGEKARAAVQEMRHECMGIMVGIGTVLADDPLLNVRLEKKKSPVRIICDSRLRIPLESRICRTAETYRTIIACGSLEEKHNRDDRGKKAEKLKAMGIEVISCPDEQGQVDIRKLMHILGEQGIDSVLLEGGGELNDSVLRAGMVQEVRVFVAPKIFGGKEAKTPVTGIGVDMPGQAAPLILSGVETIEGDVLLTYRTAGK